MRSILIGLICTIETVTTWAGWLAAATTVPLALFMVYEVVARYAFNAPTFWAYELAYMLMGAGLMLGIAYTMQMRARISAPIRSFGPAHTSIVTARHRTRPLH